MHLKGKRRDAETQRHIRTHWWGSGALRVGLSLPCVLLLYTMGPSAMRPWVLAVIALLCIWPSAYGVKRASPSGTDWVIQFSTGAESGATGGIYANISGHNDKVFLWSVTPAPVAMVTFDVEQVLNNFSASALSTNLNFTYAATTNAYFSFSTTVNGKFYFMTTDYYLLEVDPADLTGDNDVTAVSAALSLAGAGPLLHLVNTTENGTESYLVSANAADTYSVITQDDWDSSTSVSTPGIVVPRTLADPITEDNFGWKGACSITEDYGYLMASSLVNTYLFRVSAVSGVPELAMVFRETWIPSTNNPCVYINESDTFYLPLVNATSSAENVDGAVRISLFN